MTDKDLLEYRAAAPEPGLLAGRIITQAARLPQQRMRAAPDGWLHGRLGYGLAAMIVLGVTLGAAVPPAENSYETSTISELIYDEGDIL